MGNIKKVSGIKKTFYASVFKQKKTGEVVAVLSDTSLDRDEEFIGKKFLQRAAKSDFLPGLMDHENKALNLINEWVDKRVEKRMIDGETHNALLAKPKFFLSNPNAQIISNMLDEGAKLAISITAIPNSKREVERNGKSFTEWTDGEMLSADWVGIPANKHAMAQIVAKSYDLAKNFLDKDNEVNPMGNEEFDSEEFKKSLLADVKSTVETALEKSKSGRVDDLEKQVKEIGESVKTLSKSLHADDDDDDPDRKKNPSGKKDKDKDKAVDEAAILKKKEARVEELNKNLEERDALLKDLRKTPADAGKSQDKHTQDDNTDGVGKSVDISHSGFIKAFNINKKVQRGE